MLVHVSPGAEIFFQVLGTGEGPVGTSADSLLPAISDASQMVVSIAPAQLTAPTAGDWVGLSNLQVTGLGTFASGRGPEVIPPLPPSLAVGSYQLLIEVEDVGGNKMTYRVNPAFSIEVKDTIFLDRFQ